MAILDSLRSIGTRMLNTFQTPVLGVGGIIDATPPELSKILTLSKAQLEQQERIVVARAFDAGLHSIKLTSRLREFLGSEVGQFALRLNMTRKISKAISERLVLDGFGATVADEQGKALQLLFAQTVWDGSRMKGKRSATLGGAVRDGHGYLLIDFDNDNNRPRLTPHAPYTDPQTLCEGHSGDGEGVWLKYPNDDTDQKPLYAVKRWVDSTEPKSVQRINVYYPDRIEKYAQMSAGWVLIKNGRVDWRDSAGNPLGIPVVHFKAPDGLPAAFEGIPLQKALNKTLIDLLASSDATAFRILIALGWKPVDSENNPLPITPGQWVGSEMANGASVTVVEGADLGNQIAVLDKIVAAMADAVDVPLSLLNRSNQRAAEGTLQEEKESFAAKIRDYQETFEMAIEDALKIARRVHNAFAVTAGAQGTQAIYGYGEVPEQGEFRVQWAPFTTRSTEEMAREAEGLLASGASEKFVLVRCWGLTPAEAEEQIEANQGDGFIDPTRSLEDAETDTTPTTQEAALQSGL